ncbi:MAG TPA: HAMP domain-containing sensor histidine kinase [Vicinamibacterales bacterium]|jgi:signal transduction histidine kinase|nr:HAMP domain-containing sensor histidine kinase [Vicinamibacterales bacterium]
MLHDFVTLHRAAILARTREKVSQRAWPPPSTHELENGVPLFLSQLVDTLRLEVTTTPFSPDAIGASAARHGRELLALGFNVSQVVHDYGDICQAVTELAVEHKAPITTEEFHTLNRCLDTAIAEAVTEHARLTAQSKSSEEAERLGQLAHEVRNILNTALLAFDIVKRGAVAVNGSTGTVLGRSLIGLRDLVDSTLSEVRLAASQQRRERIQIQSFLGEIAMGGGLHAAYSGLQFTIEPVGPELAVTADPQLLTSAVMNLVTNAFKYTRANGRVALRAFHAERNVVVIEVEDECGGIPDGKADLFQPFGERRGKDRTGLGLGLSIARKAIRAHGGDIQIRNLPGTGCVFVIQLPAAAESPVPNP